MMHSLFHPKASRILAKPARSGSPLQSNEGAKLAPDGCNCESERTPKGILLKGVAKEQLPTGDKVLMTGFVGVILKGC